MRWDIWGWNLWHLYPCELHKLTLLFRVLCWAMVKNLAMSESASVTISSSYQWAQKGWFRQRQCTFQFSDYYVTKICKNYFSIVTDAELNVSWLLKSRSSKLRKGNYVQDVFNAQPISPSLAPPSPSGSGSLDIYGVLHHALTNISLCICHSNAIVPRIGIGRISFRLTFILSNWTISNGKVHNERMDEQVIESYNISIMN